MRRIYSFIFCAFLGLSISVFADDAGFSLQQYGMSLEQIKQAAAQGDPDAEYALGYMYYYGKGGIPRDEQSAKMWIEKAAAQGQTQAIKAGQLLGITQPAAKASTSADNAAAANTSASSPIATATMQPPTVTPEQVAQTKPIVQPQQQVSQKTHSTKMAKALGDEKRLMKEPAHHYTIQLLGSFHKQDITNFIKTHKLQSKAAVYKTKFHDRDWYVLIYGAYPSDKAAEAAIKRLSPSIQKLNPWVKSFASVQQGIKKGKPMMANNDK